MILDINDVNQLNKVFCELVGIKPVKAVLYNPETQEVKTYTNSSCLYRKPKGWENSVGINLESPQYPDFTDLDNFSLLLNLQWESFGYLGEQYIRVANESFQVNYLFMKIKAIQTVKAYGGSTALTNFVDKIRNAPFSYKLEVLVPQ